VKKEKSEDENSTARNIRLLVEYYGLDFTEVAEWLGLSYDYVRKVASKNRIWRYKRERVTDSVTQRVCRECGKRLERRGSETVCPRCGLTQPILDREQRLPFNTTYAFSNDLAFGHSLGKTLPPSQVHRVIAQAPAGRRDLPLRARLVRIVDAHVEPRGVRRLLEEGSRLLKEHGLYQQGGGHEQEYVFADRYGALLRKIGAYLHISQTRVRSYKAVTSAALYHLLQRHFSRRAEEIRSHLKFGDRELRLVRRIASLGEGP